MQEAAINISYSASSEDAGRKFALIIQENVNHENFWFQVIEQQIKYGNGTFGSYFKGIVSLVVKSDSLNDCLVQVDSIKDGYVQDPENVMANIFADVRCEVVYIKDEDIIVPLINMNQYLHNKVQEQSRAIAILEGQLEVLAKQTQLQENRINNLEKQYMSIQTYLHSYIDLNQLTKVVRTIAEETGSDALDDFTMVKIH